MSLTKYFIDAELERSFISFIIFNERKILAKNSFVTFRVYAFELNIDKI